LARIPDAVSQEPRDKSEQDTCEKAEKRSVRLSVQVSVYLGELEKADTAKPNQPNKPFPIYRLEVR
jgi:hypothetical protein